MSATLVRHRTAAACLALLLLAAITPSPASADAEPAVLNHAQIETLLASLGPRPPTNREVIRGEHYSVKVAIVDHRSGPAEFNEREDRIFIVLSGSGAVCVKSHLHTKRANMDQRVAGCTPLAMRAGSVIAVPRRTFYRMQARQSKVEFLVVRVIS